MSDSSFKRGFTLIELMITITILAITFGVIITSATAVRKAGRDGQRQSDLLTLKTALQQFYADQNYFPDSMVLTAGDPITDCPTVPASGCSPTKTYLDKTPIVPSGVNYYYRSGVDSTATNKYNNCGGGSSMMCHFYLLCTVLEGNSPQSASQYADCASFNPVYNYQLNP
jgi:prepilin-type N-terminal cleavage/methylation domain-containing protein